MSPVSLRSNIGGKIAECVERTENTFSFLGQGQGLATILKDPFLSRALQVLQSETAAAKDHSSVR
jgi:hypothetical protein